MRAGIDAPMLESVPAFGGRHTMLCPYEYARPGEGLQVLR